MRIIICLLGISLCFIQCSYAWNDSTLNKIAQFPDRVFNRLHSKTAQLEGQLTQQTQKYLQRLSAQEERLKKKLYKIDSAKAIALFKNSATDYAALEQKLASNNVPAGTGMSGEYIATLDSLRANLSFLSQHQQLLSNASGGMQSVNGSLLEVQQLQAKLTVAGEVQQFIKQREQLLTTQLSQYSFGKELAAFNNQTYYYQQQLAQYKAMLHDKDQLKAKAFTELNTVPEFQAFMAKYSYLGKLFGLPADYSSGGSVGSLQTKGMVQQMIKQFQGGAGNGMAGATGGSSGGGNPGGFLQQQMGSAQQQVTQLQNKVTQLGLPGGASNDIVMPDFSPNGQKTKSLISRLEYGFNIQTQKSNILVPNTSSIALTLGYKFSENRTAGVGLSYNMGLGNGINHIAFTNQGLTLRSYIDIKAKGSLWITGGFEYTYLKAFSNLSQIRDLDIWQKSALFGISKKYKITKNKTANLQLLFDALYHEHITTIRREK